MNESMEVLYETNAERSKLASSAVNGRPRRSRRSSCDLPSDCLTKKEMEAMNGPVETLHLWKFYDWEEFKTLSEKFQITWLNHMLDKYKPLGLQALSRTIWPELSGQTLYQFVRRNGFGDQLHTPGNGYNNSAAFRAAQLRLVEDVEKYRRDDTDYETELNPIPDQYEAEHGPEIPKLVNDIILDRHIDNGPPEIANIAFKDARYEEETMEPLGIREMHLVMHGFRLGDFVRLGELFKGRDVVLDIHVKAKEAAE